MAYDYNGDWVPDYDIYGQRADQAQERAAGAPAAAQTGSPVITPGYSGDYVPTAAPASSTGTITPTAATGQPGPSVPTPYPNQPVGATQPGTPNAVGQVTYNGDNQAYIQQLIQQLGLKGSQTDPKALNQIVAGLKGRGVNAALAPPGSGGYVKGITIDGQFIKLVDGSNNWTYLPGGDGGGAAGTTGSSLLAPFTEPFVSPGGPRPYVPPPAFNYADYTPTSAADLQTDPSFQFRLDQGRKALENSKAYEGTFRTGGAVKDFIGFNQDLASTEFGNVDARRRADYSTNRANAADTYATNYRTQSTDPYTFDVNANQSAYDRARSEYLTRADIFNQNKDSTYNKLSGTTSTGLQANA